MSDIIVISCVAVSLISLGAAYWAYGHIKALRGGETPSSDQGELPQGVTSPSAYRAEGPISDQPAGSGVISPQVLTPQQRQDVQERLSRLERTIQTLDLSHVEALKILGGRLDQVEATLERLAQVSAARFEKMEQHHPNEEVHDTQDTSSGST